MSLRSNARKIYCNNRAANQIFKFKGNSVSTTKYNVLTFLPKGLFEQFRRVANLFMLLNAILSSLPISPVSLAPNMITPTVFILASLIKEAFEDWRRFRNDTMINNFTVDILQGPRWATIPWKRLQVGDIVQIKQGQIFPADLLFLASANPDGLCYVETSNLDGETNLKIKQAVEMTWGYLHSEHACEFEGEVQCEGPNASLYTFTGNVTLDKTTVPLDPNQLLLRGCSLRNTEYIMGAVIYTGHETKIMMNDMNPPSKRSTLEKKVDKLVLILYAALLVMCVIGALCSFKIINHKYYYFGLDGKVDDSQYDPRKRLQGFIFTMYSLINLYSTVIPESLYITLEAVKFIQSNLYINRDLSMYYAKTNTPASARTSNLNEDLGQVEYVFTDKTGTLTRNSMEFSKCSIGGEVYGTGNAEREMMDTSSFTVREKGFNFFDMRIMNGAWRNEPNPDIYKEFFRCLAICNTVLPNGDESSERFTFVAASPDEAALVTAAKAFGFFLYRRSPTTFYLRESNVERMGEIKDVTYKILNVLEFSSARMRQSVVCQHPDGRLVLYCKGADSVIFERLAQGQDDLKNMTRQHLEQFGSEGLRTLCLAYKNLSSLEYKRWNEMFVRARASLLKRDEHLDKVAEVIERDLILIGCTAVKDELQDGVPSCIETLSMAGIKVWMLTGDKMEAAVNVAYACNLINNDMKQFVITSETNEIKEVEARGDSCETAHAIEEAVKTQLKIFLQEAQKDLSSTFGPKLSLVIDGKCLVFALQPGLREMLLKLSLCCSSVVCCRVSSLQKGQVTNLMKRHGKKITLGIGDGTNDVSMIQAAHIGVGIGGLDGMQAVMASDFAIAQFQYLTHLLLVHGQLSYIRISKVVTYIFYKNLVFTLTQMWFSFHTQWSGQGFYDDMCLKACNLFFTSLPVLALGIFDRGLGKSIYEKYPQLYKEGQNKTQFKWIIVVMWALSGVYQSLVLFYFVTESGVSPQTSSGKILGLWDISTMSLTCIVITVNLRLLMSCNSVTRLHHVCVWGSILAWFIFLFIYSGVMTKYDRQENVYWGIYVLMRTPYFYLTIILVPTVALMGDFLFQGIQRCFSPTDHQIIEEMHPRVEMYPSKEMYLYDERERGAIALSVPMGERFKGKTHTGFAFDSPGFESFFAAEVGSFSPRKAWDVAISASRVRGPYSVPSI